MESMDDFKEELADSYKKFDEGDFEYREESPEDAIWSALKEDLENGTVLHTKVSGVVNGGVIANIEGIRGFIPASQLSLEYVEDLNTYLNKKIDVKVITVDQEHNKLVLSAKELLKEAREKEKQEQIKSIVPGSITTGTVESLMPYGAFVDLGHNLSGLVHISQICEKRIKHPSVVLKVGDEVKVKVLDVKDGKISLSIKAANDKPAEDIEEETFEIPESEEISTSLGSLLKNLK